MLPYTELCYVKKLNDIKGENILKDIWPICGIINSLKNFERIKKRIGYFTSGITLSF